MVGVYKSDHFQLHGLPVSKPFLKCRVNCSLRICLLQYDPWDSSGWPRSAHSGLWVSGCRTTKFQGTCSGFGILTPGGVSEPRLQPDPEHVHCNSIARSLSPLSWSHLTHANHGSFITLRPWARGEGLSPRSSTSPNTHTAIFSPAAWALGVWVSWPGLRLDAVGFLT